MEENKYLEYLKKYWKKAFYAVLILACVGIWSERLFLKKSGNTKQDYLIVNQIFESYRMGNPIALESLDEAERVVKKHPELSSKYATMLSHCCYVQNQPEKALLYANSSLKRARNSLPSPYVTYSDVSLEISEKKFEQAYKHSVQLEEELARGEFEQLHAFNLLRLIFLCDKVSEDKEAYYKRLKKMASYDSIAPLFQEGSVNLETYLKSA